MIKGLVRFALVWAVSMLLAPYVRRWFERLAARAPHGSFLQATLDELSGKYASTLLHSFGETLGELALGPRTR